MVKKILFILCFMQASLIFSQENMVKDVTAYPNPFSNATTINFTSSVNTSIFFTVKNILGKIVLQKNIQITQGANSIFFYKNDLPAGIYVYSIQQKKNTISKRFIIQ